MSFNSNQTLTALTPEISLLLACGRTQVDEKTSVRIRKLAAGSVDWKSLINKSLGHGLMPLLYQNLKSEASDLVPEEPLSKLKEFYEKNSARNILLTGELNRILSLFESEGLEGMPYKGPSIAKSIYGQLSLRQFSDLDILVRKSDVWRCQQLLIAQGYEPHFNIKRRQLPAFLKLGYVQMFTRDNGLSVVELHWGIVSRFFMFSLDTDRFWSRLTRMDLMGKKVLAPTAEDLLLILSVHGAKDLWARLEWIAGIAELVRKQKDLDWEVARTRARESGAERILFLGLYLAKELFEVELPDSIAAPVSKDSAVSALGMRVCEGLVKPQPDGLRRKILFHVRSKDRSLDKLRYCTRLLFTTTPVDWEVLPLPGSLSFLYPFLRPFRLAKKYASDHSKSLFCS